MPVEIKELVIRMNTSGTGGTAPADNRQRGDNTGGPYPTLPEQEALVEACVKQVLKILEKKKAR